MDRKEISGHSGEKLPQKVSCAREKKLDAGDRNNIGDLTAADTDLFAEMSGSDLELTDQGLD